MSSNVMSFLFGLGVVLVVYFAFISLPKLECIKSHSEIQYIAPMSMVSGGIAIPMGRMRAEQVVVCDKYK